MKISASPIHFITYSNEKYSQQQKYLRVKALSLNVFDRIMSYSADDIAPQYYENNKELLDCERGAGFWCWKSYIILQELLANPDGTIILYMDCGDDFVLPNAQNLGIFLPERLKNDWILLTKGGYINRDWTKRDCLHLMNCDKEPYHSTIQLEAGIIVVRRCAEAISFISQWNALCQIPTLINDDFICGFPNYEGFKDHRHDQAILSLLAIRHGIAGVDDLRRFITCNVNQPKEA